MRLPVVDDDGLIECQRQLKLPGKKRLLLFPAAVVPIVIKPYFPYRDAFFVFGEAGYLFKGVVRQL